VSQEITVLLLPAVAEEGVAFALFGNEVFGFCEEAQRLARGVVGREPPGRLGGGVLDRFVAIEKDDFAEFLQVLGRDRTGTQDLDNGLGITGEDLDDGRLETFGTGAAVDDERDATLELIHHERGRGRAEAAEEIGARCRDGTAEVFDDAMEDGVIALAHRHGRESGGDDVGDDGLFRHEQGERAGPEGLDELDDRF